MFWNIVRWGGTALVVAMLAFAIVSQSGGSYPSPQSGHGFQVE